MPYWIVLMVDGNVLSRTTVQRVTNVELQTAPPKRSVSVTISMQGSRKDSKIPRPSSKTVMGK
jgi:hypothetical protein